MADDDSEWSPDKDDFDQLVRMFRAYKSLNSERTLKNQRALKTAIQAMETLSGSGSPDGFLKTPKDISLWKGK